MGHSADFGKCKSSFTFLDIIRKNNVNKFDIFWTTQAIAGQNQP